MEVIKYKDASYPVRWVNDGVEAFLVSVDVLQDALIDDSGNYRDSSAEFIDNTIYYYLSADEFMKSNDEIINIIK